MEPLFEIQEVNQQTIEWVRSRLETKRGGWVYGTFGSGKSHALRKAVSAKDACRIDVTSGPLLGQRFIADLARQIGPDGRHVLEAVRHQGLATALQTAGKMVNGRPLIVDGADRLARGPVQSLDEPATELWQQEKSTVLDWLSKRLDSSPTFLVGRRLPANTAAGTFHRHRPSPSVWPLNLKRTTGGFRNWGDLARLAGGNAAILILARALVPLMTAHDFNELVEQTKEQAEDVSIGSLFQRLGRAFQSSAPPLWQQALALLTELGEVPRDVLAPVLGAQPTMLHRLLELKLIEERPGGLAVLPALAETEAIRPLTERERSEFLPAAAHRLLAPINDLKSLLPSEADRVLRAHAIFVELGDMTNAERTASLHVHGLIELARRTSLNFRHEEAWRQYDGVLRMIQAGSWNLEDETGRHLRSYVRHYRAWNGAVAGILDNELCLAEYRAALADWPKNALWHERTIETLIRLTRLVEARQAIKEAYAVVEEHPRRDALLRVQPAKTALNEGAPLMALELIEPVLDSPAELYPEVSDGREDILRRWVEGISLLELPFPVERSNSEGRLVFLRPTKVSVQRTLNGWVARLPELSRDARADRPLGAVEILGRALGEEARRLISVPSSDLSDVEARRKGLLLSLVDALNSDIGLAHAPGRWLVGRVEGSKFLPVMRALPTVELPATLIPESTEGLYIARVPIYRDGQPSGPALALEPAGRGRSLEDLLQLLARLSEGTA